MERIQVIQEFYSAFQAGDAEKMVSHYADNVQFEDPAFGRLSGEDAANMWRMLIERSKGQLQIEFSDIKQNGDEVTAHWEAKYPFSKTGRFVHNIIEATFEFNGDKIIKHTDDFNFWRWSHMALGLPGKLLGWSPILQNKVKKQCLDLLDKYKNT
ncbi:MAG: nuclear transport factor 2 family protein [Cyclobacteriaceae bacterium]